MNNTDKVLRGYVAKRLSALSQHRESPAVTAQLAELRRGIGKKPGELPQLWGSFLLDMPEELLGKGDEPSKAEWAVYITLTMYALHQQGKAEPVYQAGDEHRLGRAVGRMVQNEDDRERVAKRFASLALAEDMSGLAHHLRGIIQLLKAQDIPLDYIDLAGDIFWFQTTVADSVRLKWGRDFYWQNNNREDMENADRKEDEND